MTAQETLAQLVAIDSVSSHSNAAIIDYLEKQCERLGFRLSRYSYTDGLGAEKTNLIAIAGTTQSEVELALVGHTDTVPYDPNWADATTLTAQNGNLYARGACDTKGFIAAALRAVESVDIQQLKKPLALIFTADEEIGLLGAKYLADLKPVHINYAVVGEPTSLQPIRAGKGYSLAEVVVRGREAHSAYPALGSSAVFRAARLVSRLELIANRITAQRHDLFDPPFTTLNVGLIKGGSAKNVIAGECRFTLEWRPIPGQDSAYVLDLLNEAIQEEQSTDDGFACEIDAGRADAGFETPADSPLVSFLEQISGRTAGTVSFGTEAAQMRLLGSDAVVIGPGDIRVAHRSGEFVPEKELNLCAEILKKTIDEFCF